jgi:hypothetical protein
MSHRQVYSHWVIKHLLEAYQRGRSTFVRLSLLKAEHIVLVDCTLQLFGSRRGESDEFREAARRA